MPAQLKVRELRLRVEQPGFRVNELVLVMTMVGGGRYSEEELADLSLQRWHIGWIFARSNVHGIGMDCVASRRRWWRRKQEAETRASSPRRRAF